MHSFLSVRDLKVHFSSGFTLQLPTWEIQQGLYHIKGANGSGKSTLFRSLAGIQPFEGAITLDGISLKASPVAYRKQISLSEAEPVFPDFLSLKDVMDFVAKARNATAEEQAALCDVLGVNAFKTQTLKGYSSGMLKKAGLLLAFLGNPALVLLDEPYVTIDVETQARLTELILNRAKAGTSFIITSHTSDHLSEIPFQETFTLANGQWV